MDEGIKVTSSVSNSHSVSLRRWNRATAPAAARPSQKSDPFNNKDVQQSPHHKFVLLTIVGCMSSPLYPRLLKNPVFWERIPRLQTAKSATEIRYFSCQKPEAGSRDSTTPPTATPTLGLPEAETQADYLGAPLGTRAEPFGWARVGYAARIRVGAGVARKQTGVEKTQVPPTACRRPHPRRPEARPFWPRVRLRARQLTAHALSALGLRSPGRSLVGEGRDLPRLCVSLGGGAHEECLQGDVREHMKTNFPFLPLYHKRITLQDPAGGSPCAKNSVAFPVSHLTCFSQRNEVAVALG